MKKRMFLSWIALGVLLSASLLAALTSSGGAGPPPPPPVPDPGLPAFGPKPEIGKPFNFSGIVAEINGQGFSLVDRWFYLPGEPPVSQEPSLSVSVGKTTRIIRDSLLSVSGIETAAFSDVQRNQLVSVSGIISGLEDDGWKMEAVVITIQKDNYLLLD